MGRLATQLTTGSAPVLILCYGLHLEMIQFPLKVLDDLVLKSDSNLLS